MISTMHVNDMDSFEIICTAFHNINASNSLQSKALLFDMMISFIYTNWNLIQKIDKYNNVRLSLVYLVQKNYRSYETVLPDLMLYKTKKYMNFMFGHEVVNLIT